jgi:hypothetical protein
MEILEPPDNKTPKSSDAAIRADSSATRANAALFKDTITEETDGKQKIAPSTDQVVVPTKFEQPGTANPVAKPDVSKETTSLVPSAHSRTVERAADAVKPVDNGGQPVLEASRPVVNNQSLPMNESRLPSSDKVVDALPKVEIARSTPTALSDAQRLQPGVATAGAETPVLQSGVRLQDLGQAPSRAADASTKGIQVSHDRSLTGEPVKSNEMAGKDPGVKELGANAAKLAAVDSKEPTSRLTSPEMSRTPGDSITRPDGVRSGIDHTSQGILARQAEARGEIRTAPISLTEGKIAEPRTNGSPLEGIRTDRTGMSPADGKIAEGKLTDTRLGEPKTVEAKVGELKPGDLKPLDKVADKSSDATAKSGDKTSDGRTPAGRDGSSSGPSAFIQFIENQAGLRGVGIPAKSDKSDKSEKADKGDKSVQSDKLVKADKADKAVKDPVSRAESGIKDAMAKGDKPSGGSAVKIEGTRPGVVDNLIGMVENVKDSIKSTFKNQGDKAQSIPLNPGELAVVGQRGKLPQPSEHINSAQIIAVLIPAGMVNWSIVRSPDRKPSDNPTPIITDRTGRTGGRPVTPDALGVTSGAADKPFDINQPPDAKPRPFIQLHGLDSDYKGGNKVQPPRPDAPAARSPEVPTAKQPPVDVSASKQPNSDAAPVPPWLDSGKGREVPPAAQSLIDQSSTRPSIPPEPKSRAELIAEQEHTLPVAFEDDSLEDIDDVELPAVVDDSETQSEKRLRYVNRAIDSQEATWNSEDEEVDNALQSPLGRYTYIVRSGDSVESVAVAELNDATLAPLIFKKNRKYVLPEVDYGVHPLLAGVVIDLPTPKEIAEFRQF